MPLPKASDIGFKAIEDKSNTIEHHRVKIERWIESHIVHRLSSKDATKVDMKNRVVKGYVTHEAPSEYYGCSGITRDQWKEIFESIIRPLGYEPVYTWDGGGIHDVVGIRWEWAIP